MNKKIVGIFVCTLLIAATVIPVAGTLINLRDMAIDSSGSEEGVTKASPWYNPAGCWMRGDKRYIGTTSLISMEGGGRYAQVGEYLADDPSLLWAGVSAMSLSTIHGETIRIGHNTYQTTLFAYAINETYDIVYYAVYSGSTEMTSQDTMAASFTVAYYNSSQDPFGDEAPAYGCFGPYQFSYERIPIVPPC